MSIVADPWVISKQLTDKYSVQILMATRHKAMDAISLSYQLGIPIAVCYRRLKELEDIGLITVVGKRLTKKGKWIKLYKSNIKSAEIDMEDNKVKLRLSMKGDVSQEFDLF